MRLIKAIIISLERQMPEFTPEAVLEAKAILNLGDTLNTTLDAKMVRQQYLEEIQKHHPDKHPGLSGEEAAEHLEQTKLLSNARDILNHVIDNKDDYPDFKKAYQLGDYTRGAISWVSKAYEGYKFGDMSKGIYNSLAVSYETKTGEKYRFGKWLLEPATLCALRALSSSAAAAGRSGSAFYAAVRSEEYAVGDGVRAALEALLRPLDIKP